MTHDRRAFLWRAGVALPGVPRLLADDSDKAGPRRITLSKEPLNLEMPFASVDRLITPTALHYVRNHYPIPKLDAASYRLEVSGAVGKRLSLSLAELKKLKAATRTVTLECAGNGRSFIRPAQKGVQWGLGGVSTAEWTGVPLASVLEMAGLRKEAVEVILDGADKGDPKKEIQPATPISFSRSLSVAKAKRPEVLLAWAMNGEPLRPEHGYPLRAIVAGWYGMASVKWLRRIIAVTRPFNGFDQTIDYGVWVRGEDGLDRLEPITEMQVKASVARPSEGEVVAVGKAYRVHGAAWAGESAVAKVEVSADGGKTWAAAKLLGQEVPFAWRLWEWAWVPAKGETGLRARATDRRGRAQPLKHDANRRSYMANFVRATGVVVKA